MARTVLYLLKTKHGPTEAEQIAAIRRVIKPSRTDETYADDLTARRGPNAPLTPARESMLRQLRKGDRVAIATPGCLGTSKEDMRAALHALARKGNRLVDASTGKELLWTDEIADHLEFLERGARERGADTLRGARAAKKAAGIVYRPPPKEFSVSEEAAELIWRDSVRYSRDEAGAVCGVSWRTLHNRFGGRTEAMGYRPQQKKKGRAK